MQDKLNFSNNFLTDENKLFNWKKNWSFIFLP